MKNFFDKLNAEIEKGKREAEAMKAHADLPAGQDPDTDARIRKARASNRQIGGYIALFGAVLCVVVYGFYLKYGNLFYGLALLGLVCIGCGLFQVLTGKAVKGK